MVVLFGVKRMNMKLVWLDMEVYKLRKKSHIKVISPSGNHINFSFHQSHQIVDRKLNNTIRMIRVLFAEGSLGKKYDNKVRVECSYQEMNELKRVSELI